MTRKLVKSNASPFEKIRKINEYDPQYQFTRDLFKLIGYAEFRYFKPIISKAMKAYKNSGEDISTISYK